jgi:hypothetical protein
MTRELCQFFEINEGAITMGCDSTSALLSGVDNNIEPTSRITDHDMLFAIRQIINNIPVKLLWQHVKGHQDDKKSKDELTRPEQLNCEMDKETKETVGTLDEPLVLHK